MSNLLQNQTISEKVKQEVVERNPSLWRGLIFEASSLLSAIWLGFVFKLYVSNQPAPLLGIIPGYGAVIIALSIFFLTSLFHVILIKDTGRRVAVQICQVLALGFFLYDESVSWLATEAAALLLLLSGTWRARGELKNSVTVRFFRLAGLYYSRLVIALALMGTIFYFPYWQQTRAILPQAAFDGVASWSLGIASNFYPTLNLTSNSTFEEVVASMAENEIAKLPGGALLSEAEKATVRAQATEALSIKLRDQLGGLSPELNETITNFLYRVARQSMEQLESYLGSWFFVGWTAIVLLLSFSLGRVYSLIMSAFAFIIYQILITSRFVNIYTENVSKETLDF